MKIGMIGLGKMGANIAENLMEHAVDVTGFDLNEAAHVQAAALHARFCLLCATDSEDMRS